MNEELKIAKKYCNETEAMEGQRILAEIGIDSKITGSTIFTSNFIENTYYGINLLVREEDFAAAVEALNQDSTEPQFQDKKKLNPLILLGLILFSIGFGLFYYDFNLYIYAGATCIAGIIVFFKGLPL